MSTCPFCAEAIQGTELVCPHCGSTLRKEEPRALASTLPVPRAKPAAEVRTEVAPTVAQTVTAFEPAGVAARPTQASAVPDQRRRGKIIPVMVALSLIILATVVVVIVKQASAPGTDSEFPDLESIPKEIQVKLLDPGVEPRRELRFKYRAGEIATLVVGNKSSMSIEVGDTSTPESVVPPIRMIMTFVVKQVMPDDACEYEFRLEKMEVAPDPAVDAEVAARVGVELEKLVGLSGAVTVDNRGLTRSATLNVPDGLSAQMQSQLDGIRQSISSFSAPLPAEPVGKGARWETVAPLDLAAFKMVQITTSTLTSLDGDRGSLEVSFRQTAPTQPMTMPQAGVGGESQLESFATKGSGSSSFDLANLVATGATSAEMESVVSVTNAGQTQSVKTKMRFSTTIEAVEGGEAIAAPSPAEPPPTAPAPTGAAESVPVVAQEASPGNAEDDGLNPNDLSGVEPDGQKAKAHLNQGRQLEVAGDHEGAIREYRLAVSTDGDLSWAWGEMSYALNKLERYRYGIVASKKAIELGGDPKMLGACYFNLGFAHEQLGDRSAAISAYEKSLENRPGHAYVTKRLEALRGGQ